MKKKIVIGIVSSVLLVIVITFGVLSYMNNDYDFNYEPLVYEFGEYEVIKLEDIVEDEEILKTSVLDIEDNSEAVGDYKASIAYNYRYKDRKFDFTYSILDTKAPDFIDFKDTIRIEQNVEDVQVIDYFKAKDLSGDVTLTISDDKFDFSALGKHNLILTATDKYNNKTEKTITVNIVDLESARKDGVSQTLEGIKPQSKELVKVIEEEKKNKLALEQAAKDAQNQNNINQDQSSGQNTNQQKPASPKPQAYDMSNPIVAKAIAMVGTVNEGGFGPAGIGGSFVCDDLVAVALEAGGLGAYAHNYPSDFSSYVPYSQVKPGDVVRYVTADGSSWAGHVAIYIGNGNAAHGNFGRVTTIFSATGLDNTQVEPLVWKVK